MKEGALECRQADADRLEAVGTFAGAIGHELNNLLVAIMGYAEMAGDRLEPHSTTREYIENIVDAGAKVQQVIDQIVTFSSTRIKPSKPLDLIDAIAKIVPALYASVSQSVRTSVEIPDAPLVIAGSTDELQRILVNLFKNAGEALRVGGTVALVIDAIELQAPRSLSHGHLLPGKYVRVHVSDSGPGTAPEHLSRIFEPFFTTKPESGAGLGLSVVYGTVRSLGGALHVRSTLGAGTCFELYFPRLDDAAWDTSRSPSSRCRHSRAG